MGDEQVNHPKHYNSHPSGIEAIEVMRPMHCDLANAVKYLWRAGEKGPAEVDLAKARWYLEDLRKVGKSMPMVVLMSATDPWVKLIRKVIDSLKGRHEPHHLCISRLCLGLDRSCTSDYVKHSGHLVAVITLGEVEQDIAYAVGVIDGVLGVTP